MTDYIMLKKDNMTNEKKEELKVEMQDGISKICDNVISLSVSDENFELAAAIRDARNELIDAINEAIDNLLPF